MIQDYLDYASVLLAYSLLMVLLPTAAVHALRPGAGRIRTLFYGYLAGNLGVILLVYGLAFLGVYTRGSFLSLYALMIVGALLWAKRREALRVLRWLRGRAAALLGGTLRGKTFARQVLARCRLHMRRKRLRRGRLADGAELLAVAAVLVGIGFVLSHRALTLVSFSAPDEEVHLQWIQSLLGNELFHSGIYPFGMHNVTSALCWALGQEAAVVHRFMGSVCSVWGFAMSYLALRAFTRNRLAALLGFAGVLATCLFSSESLSRFQFPVPHEFAIPFVLVMGCCLIGYVLQGRRGDLIAFGAGFALTLLSHFHATIMAGVLCVCIGAALIVPAWKNKRIAPILICGALAVGVGAAPVLGGLAQGKPFEQSMAWAVSVISGNDNLAGEDDEPEQAESLQEPEPEKPSLLEELSSHSYRQPSYTRMMLGLCAAGLLLYLIRLIRARFSAQALARLPFYLWGLAVLVMMVSDPLGIPILLYPTRLVAYMFFLSMFWIAAPLEELAALLPQGRAGRVLATGVSAAALLAAAWIVPKQRLWVPFPEFYYYQTTGASRAVNAIMRTYPKQQWTVVSTVTETSMVWRSGFHYEWIDFIDALQDGEELVIPTQYVFFLVEKMPIVRFGWSFMPDDPLLKQRPPLNLDDAQLELAYEENREDYYKDQRDIVMAKADRWVQRARACWPVEMDVYYEDPEVVVYRLIQNGGYNDLNMTSEGDV